MPSLQWSHRFSAVETRTLGDAVPAPCLPSMEPPLFGSGNLAVTCSLWSTISLQWSHRFSAVETSCAGETRQPEMSFNGATAFRQWKQLVDTGLAVRVVPSMEPPLFGSGNQCSRRLCERHLEPSIEPPLFGSGNSELPRSTSTAASLQWSHRFSAVETTSCVGSQKSTTCLQWSHRFSAVETLTTATT